MARIIAMFTELRAAPAILSRSADARSQRSRVLLLTPEAGQSGAIRLLLCEAVSDCRHAAVDASHRVAACGPQCRWAEPVYTRLLLVVAPRSRTAVTVFEQQADAAALVKSTALGSRFAGTAGTPPDAIPKCAVAICSGAYDWYCISPCRLTCTTPKSHSRSCSTSWTTSGHRTGCLTTVTLSLTFFSVLGVLQLTGLHTLG